MTTLSPTHSLPTTEEIAIARESGRTLSTYLQTRTETQQIDIFDDKGAAHPVPQKNPFAHVVWLHAYGELAGAACTLRVRVMNLSET